MVFIKDGNAAEDILRVDAPFFLAKCQCHSHKIHFQNLILIEKVQYVRIPLKIILGAGGISYQLLGDTTFNFIGASIPLLFTFTDQVSS